MPIKSLDYIITAKHYAAQEGAKSVRQRIENYRRKLHVSKGIVVQINDLGKDPSGPFVQARIENGQWIADCECGGAEFVDPDEPLFFCFSCGNRNNLARPRPVIFPEPDQRAMIEQIILERPVDDLRGLNDLERAGQAKALIMVQMANGLMPLTRSWNPGETVDDLRRQNRPIEKWRKALKDGKA